jgi:hypothetical protein
MDEPEGKITSDELGKYFADEFNLEICEIVSRKKVFNLMCNSFR